MYLRIEYNRFWKHAWSHFCNRIWSPLDHDKVKMAVWYTRKLNWKRRKNAQVLHLLCWYTLRCSRDGKTGDGRQEAKMKLETRIMEGMIKERFRGLTFLGGSICVCSLQYTFSHKCFSFCALLRSVANEVYSMYRFPHWRCLIDSHVLQALASPTSSILSPEDGKWKQAYELAFTGSRVGPRPHYTHPWRSQCKWYWQQFPHSDTFHIAQDNLLVNWRKLIWNHAH